MLRAIFWFLVTCGIAAVYLVLSAFAVTSRANARDLDRMLWATMLEREFTRHEGDVICRRIILNSSWPVLRVEFRVQDEGRTKWLTVSHTSPNIYWVWGQFCGGGA